FVSGVRVGGSSAMRGRVRDGHATACCPRLHELGEDAERDLLRSVAAELDAGGRAHPGPERVGDLKRRDDGCPALVTRDETDIWHASDECLLERWLLTLAMRGHDDRGDALGGFPGLPVNELDPIAERRAETLKGLRDRVIADDDEVRCRD